MEKNRLINLKEASQISGYSADYIGQLIRSGKIPGKQVYSNVSWMTTAEAVMNYKNKGKDNNIKFKDKIISQKRIFSLQIDLIKLIFKNFQSAMLIILVIIAGFLLFGAYFFYLILDDSIEQKPIQKVETNQNLRF